MIVPSANINDGGIHQSQNSLSVASSDSSERNQYSLNGIEKTTVRLTEVAGRRGADHAGKIFSLASYVEVLFVRKYLFLSCIFLSLLMGWVALIVWPRSYESEAKLILRIGRESVALDPTATTSQTLMLQKTQEEEVNSALEILSSRQIAERIVEELGASAIISGSPAKDDVETSETWLKTNVTWLKKNLLSAVDQITLASGVRDPVSEHETAVIKVQRTIGIYAPKKSTAITIHAESKTPEMAQSIVRVLTEQFLKEHVTVSKTEGSHLFFEKQAGDAEKKLNEMLLRRSGMLKERKIASVESRHVALASQLGVVESTLLSSQSELQQSLAEIDDLIEKSSKTENEIIASKQKQGDQTWSTMRNKLYELEMDEKRLASQYAPGHSQLVQIQEQVVGAREILGKLESEREDRSTTPNPVKLRIEEGLQRTRTAVVGLRSMITEIEAQQATKQKEIRELLDFEVELGQLDREIAIAKSSLEMLQVKQEEARVIDDLQAQHISSVGVFQPATFVERAVSPKKSIVAVAFVMLGLFGGIGWVFMRELTSTTLRTPEHVEKNLDCPVLAIIPYSHGLTAINRIVKSGDLSEIRGHCKSILSEVLLSRPQSKHGNFRGKTIGVIGVEDGCGASSVAVGLALASSEDAGMRTTLIDFDLMNRTVSGAFGLNGAPGFAELVSGEAGRDDCTQRFEHRPLSLISGSSTKTNRRIEADPTVVANVLNELLDQNDIVIVDLPPASRPDQTLTIAQHLDQVLVVVESEKTDLVAVKRLLRQLGAGNADLVGIVLNKSRNRLPTLLASLLR